MQSWHLKPDSSEDKPHPLPAWASLLGRALRATGFCESGSCWTLMEGLRKLDTRNLVIAPFNDNAVLTENRAEVETFRQLTLV